MNEKTSEPKAMIELNFDKKGNICQKLEDGKIVAFQPDGGYDSTERIFILDEGDSMAMNSSTNYDHHYRGAGLINIMERRNGTERNEYYVNSKEPWRWIERMMRLGAMYITEHPEFNAWDYDEQLKEEFENRESYTSFHKKKKQ